MGDIGGLKLWFGVAAVIVAAIVFTWALVPPPPPSVIRLASGPESGAYHRFAQRYKDLLKREGFTLDIQSSKGSVDNLDKLRRGEVDVAFIQGGTSAREDKGKLATLGSLYREPLWVFYRGQQRLEYLKQLAGRRLSLGAEGSGTRKVALELLTENGFPKESKLYQAMPTRRAVKALEQGQIDALFVCVGPRSPLIRRLLERPDVRLMSVRRQHAYCRQHRFLSGVLLGEGIIDLERNIPGQDYTLLAPTAQLAVREDVHPIVVLLMLTAASAVHEQGGVFEETGEFPAPKYIRLPLHPDARRFYKYGPSFLQRILPLWLAALLNRLKIMLLPLITLVIPLAKIAPPVYRWRIRSTIFRWYRLLRRVDEHISKEGPLSDPEHWKTQLVDLERELEDVEVPLSYMEEFYNLKVHIHLIHEKLERRLQASE